MMKILALSVLAIFLAGCCSMKICDEGGRRMCYIENTGWFLLNSIPIGSGNPKYPNGGYIDWFADSATLENNILVLDNVLKDQNATSVKNLSSYWTEESIFLILLKRHIRHTSAEIIGGNP